MEQKKKIHSLIVTIYLISIVIVMIGFAYISVPLYQLYCQSFGGTGNPFSIFGKNSHNIKISENSIGISNVSEKTQEINKPITVYFHADSSEDLQNKWNFKPCLQKLQVYPGDTALSFYIAENKTDTAISGISTYNLTPSKVGIYFNKIQCFCFEEQRLKPNESVEMPILFFLDPEFEKDPKMKDVDVINLSYTFYKVS